MNITRRDFGKHLGAFVGGIVLGTGCNSGGGGKKNKPPFIDSISRSFKNYKDDFNGTVYYKIFASDPDGEIDEICIKFNDEEEYCYPSPVAEFPGDLREGRNTLMATAYDNKGKPSEPAYDEFEVPSYGDAYRHIKEMLEESLKRGEFKELKTFPSPDEQTSPDFPGKIVVALEDILIPVDFKIVRNDERIALINYIRAEDFDKELGYRDMADNFKINNLYFFATPIYEIHGAMEDFIKKGYTREF